ncbi:MAG: HAD family phosphatase [Clostridiales bacterium]|nr:HAD family phosphatase [Clostridiales bacterium]
MGKFDGVMIATDYDNTLVYTESALLAGGVIPPVSPGNRQAITYFMEQGGTFSVATGRALPAFAPLAAGIPMNAPSVLFNGAAIYDFFQKAYVCTAFLPDSVRDCVRQVLGDFPDIAMEIYHDDNSVHAINPNELTERHVHLTHAPTVTLQSIDEVPSPISKIVFEEPAPILQELLAYFKRQPWHDEYEFSTSGSYLLELTAHGADKGGMVRRLVEILGQDPCHLYCVGDHANDISMLTYAHEAFAPANALAAVQQLPGIHVLPDCREDAIAAMIDQLDRMY